MRKSVLILVPLIAFFLPCSVFTAQPFDLAGTIRRCAFDWESVYADTQYIYGALDSTGSGIYPIGVWNRSDFTLATYLADGQGTMNSVYADSYYIYGASADNNIYAWKRDDFSLNTTDGIGILTNGQSAMEDVFADSTRLYGGSDDSNVYVWTRPQAVPTPFFLETALTADNAVHTIDADSAFIYGGTSVQNIWIWDTATYSLNTILNASSGDNDELTAVQSKPGTFIYASTYDRDLDQGFIWIWNWDDFALNTTLTRNTRLNDMFVGDTFIYAAGGDHNVYMWDRLTLQLNRVLTPTSGDPYSYFRCIFADDFYIFGGSDGPFDENLYIWYLRTPPGQTVLGTIQRKGIDQNLYQFYAPEPFDTSRPGASGDWTYWDAAARNPSPYFPAKDLWMVPKGNNVVAAAPVDIDGDGYDEVAVMKNTRGDYNLYIYESLEINKDPNFDVTYWDAFARNPSPLAQDFWYIPAGNNTISIAGVDTNGDGIDEIAVLKNKGGRQALYYYNAPAPGDYYWPQAFERNGLGPYAYDIWYVPAGSDIVAMAAADGVIHAEGEYSPDQLVTIKNQGGKYNLYVWKSPNTAGVYNTEFTNRFLQVGWDGFGSPQAQDTSIIPQRNDIVSITAVRSDDMMYDALGVMENYNGDYNYYLWKLPVFPDHTYDDALARQYGRNHFGTPQARDFWIIPSPYRGNTQFLLGITK